MLRHSSQMILGIDGGGTKTTCAIATSGLNILAQAKSGASNPNVVGFEQSAAVLLQLIKDCCKKVMYEPGGLKKICIGVAGIGRETDKTQLLKTLTIQSGKAFVKKIILKTDIEIALESAFPEKSSGIVIIAGTGSIVLSSEGKKITRAGGWGRMLGDDGSGTAIARDAIREILRSHESLAKRTVLGQKLLKHFNINTVNEIISYAASKPISSFAEKVIKSASDGDIIAQDILLINALALAEKVETVFLRLNHRKNIPVVLYGSLIDHKNYYSSLLKKLLKEMLPGIIIQQPAFPPVYGALNIARNSLH